MNKTLENRTIALAALFQSVYAVNEIATTGDTRINIEGLLCSVFNTAPQDVPSVYTTETRGASQNLQFGFNKVIDNFTKNKEPTLLYVIALLSLQRKLLKNEPLLQILSNGIEQTASRLEHFEITHDNIFASLGDLYSQTVSKLSPRIIIKGDAQYLRAERHANKIRTLLLCGIRAGILWQQCGGSKWELLFSGKKVAHCATQLMHHH